jgi:hypothetical protein
VVNENAEVVGMRAKRMAAGDGDSLFGAFAAPQGPLAKHILIEWLANGSKGPEGRRCRYELFPFSCFLYKHSAAGYEIMRQILPLPTRQSLDRHFGCERLEKARDLTDVDQIGQQLRKHCDRYGIPLNSSVVVAYDATGRNGGGGGTG